MKIVVARGCTADSLEFNGKDIRELTYQEEEEIIDYLLKNVKIQIQEGSITLDQLIELFQYDDYESSEPCDQCGDSVTTTTWNI